MVDKAVKFPEPKVKIPVVTAFVIAPVIEIFPVPCVNVPLFESVLRAVKLNELVFNVNVAGIVNAFETVVFPVKVLVPDPEKVSELYVVPFTLWLAPE